MIACPACGYENAASSHFCRHCGATLQQPSPAPAATPPSTTLAPTPTAMPAVSAMPIPAADAELQAQLITTPAAVGEGVPTPLDTAEPPAHPTQPLVAPPELEHGDQVLVPGTKVGEYTIIELREEQAGQRVYRAEAPANVCQQCGTRSNEPGAHFCEECGAELLPHDVLLYERASSNSAETSGPWRLIDLPDEPVRSLLPPATVFEANGRRYLVAEEHVPGYQSLAELLASRGETPQQPAALDENDALPLALQLAHLIEFLHRNETALGDLSLAQLLIGPKQVLRLRDATDLQSLNEERRKADLTQLARTLEDLTRTPRPTIRLDAEAVDAPPRPSLDNVISQGRMGALPDAAAWVTALEAVATSHQAVQALQTQVGARTDVGMHRELNEDSLLVEEARLGLTDQLVNAGVYVVADGMGGHESGEVASRLAVLAISQTVSAQLAQLAADTTGGVTDDKLNDIVLKAAEAANQAVFQESQRRHNDMGTTLTFALVVGDRCMIGNVGDSRTYLLHEGKLQRITKDHSLVMRLVEVGQISEDEIYTHPHRNAILRSLGEKLQVEVDTFPLRLQPGDALLMCSDGEWEMVRNPRINEVLTATADPQAAVEQLIAEANQNGGEDNITAVLVRFAPVAKRVASA
ncbi:MAG: Stp1/IreP family PP2C-type Ser/Thr phosphatase [Herpetosiphonaceae bacterium]|nr:Stp1/IreP family PP2C-type Ser/Thr phosphatase [Herpetosiphonaceae bacterium]